MLPTHRSATAAVLVLLVLALTACDPERRKVTIRPHRDGSFGRTLRMWVESRGAGGTTVVRSAPSDEDVAFVRPHYDGKPKTVEGVVVFEGTFREVPGDIQLEEEKGRGGYETWTTRMGWFGVYRERRPGPTNYAERQEAITKAVDMVSTVLATAIRNELDGVDGAEELAAFVRGEFRRDAKDVCLLLDARADDRPGSDPYETESLLLQLLSERDYLGLREAVRLEQLAEEDLERRVARIAARKVRGKPDPALAARIVELLSEDRMKAAFEVAREEHGWSEKDFEEVGEEIGPIITLFSPVKDLAIECELPPGAHIHETTGERAGDGKLTWWTLLADRPVKSVFSVEFSVPDRAWQQKRFGKCILEGDSLKSYVLWLTGLPRAQAADWEHALEGLTPGEDLRDRIEAIRVPGVPDEIRNEGVSQLLSRID